MDDKDVTATVNGKIILIPLGLNRPKIQNFNDFEEWLRDERKYANVLKKRLEKGDVPIDSVEEEMIRWSVANRERKKEKCLKTEKKLLYLDLKIKSALTSGRCKLHLTIYFLCQMKKLNITQIMLKKHPEIVKTLLKIVMFRGNKFQRKEVKKMRKHARHILKKMIELFCIPSGKSFFEVFAKEGDAFNESVSDLNITELNKLDEEPHCTAIKPHSSFI